VRIEEIKERIDPIEVIGRYTKLRPAGGKLQAACNPIREERTSSLFYYPDTGKWYDFGTGEGGDVIDFIERAEGVDRREALSLLSAMIGSDTTPRRAPVKRETPPPKPRDEETIRLTLEERAAEYLSAAPMRRLNGIRRPMKKWAPMILEIDGKEIQGIRIHPAFAKLFESPDCFIPTEEKFADYLFRRVIGWDEYFQCPVIVIRDESERVADIIRYRPHREGYSDLPKYHYTRNAEKPQNQPLFFLQAQMMRIMMNMRFCILTFSY